MRLPEQGPMIFFRDLRETQHLRNPGPQLQGSAGSAHLPKLEKFRFLPPPGASQHLSGDGKRFLFLFFFGGGGTTKASASKAPRWDLPSQSQSLTTKVPHVWTSFAFCLDSDPYMECYPKLGDSCVLTSIEIGTLFTISCSCFIISLSLLSISHEP